MANAHIAINVLDAWIRYQPAARLVGMSTLWAYPEKIAAAREDSYWDGRMHQPTEHYGIVKKLLGVGIQAARREHGLRGTMLVLGNVYGPNDSSHHVIPSLIRRMRENPARLEIQGDGSQTRDFIYVDDQVESIIQHLNCDRELLNIGSGTTTSIRELVAVLARALPYHGEIVFKSEAGFGVDQRRIDVSRATEETGWPASYQVHTLDEGIAKTVATLN
jgi:UDP-glucose 4-epimerase